ncbi:hypothetical protein U2F26_33375 [Micromonospora sp. 4G57]|uniref:Uncharacterized protein n=1 Tax=Micromonospora sicca TaxID=2202420 RepID=A0ABU5JNY5_9ACTN|nr:MULTISPECIES: hypothetical protein [unclassified Micromonospora]MDZ5447543.1 hypothetical protein [Micromonospora sp. 4G57]MDZ5494301.1 hypothetical protein [Micromonospora sp. 4G53]
MRDATSREYALLDWLVSWRPPEPSAVASLGDLFDGDPPAEEMDLWLETLQDVDRRGLIKAHLVFGIFNSAVVLTGRGRAETEARHKRRDDPLRRAQACRQEVLRWVSGSREDLAPNLLSLPRAAYEGDVFTQADVSDAVDYLIGGGLLSAGDGIAGNEPPTNVLRLTSRGRRYLEGGGSDRSNSSTTVHVYGDNHGTVYVGNRDVTHASAPAQRTATARTGAAAGEDEPIAFATDQPPQFERWSVLPPAAARLALYARDQSSVYNSPVTDGGKRAEFRFLWRVACTELPAARRAKQISDALLALLGSVAMINALARHVDIDGLAWARYGDHARASFGAVLRAPGDDGEPAAWARFSPPPAAEHQLFGRESGSADLLLAVRFGDGGGPLDLPVSLAAWPETFTAWLETFGSVGDFLTGLGLDLTAQPAARAAVAISTRTDLGDVVDLTSIPRIPGTSVSGWFHTVAAADRSGVSVSDVSSAWLAAMCEDALHLDDYDSALGR